MRLFGYATFGLGLGLLLLAGSALLFDLGALKPIYERVASHYLEREVRVEGEMSVRLGRSITPPPLTSQYQRLVPTRPRWRRLISSRCGWRCPRYSTNSSISKSRVLRAPR